VTVGERVRALRLEREWTQVELAEAASIDKSSISQIESDKDPVGPARAARLAEAFGIPVEDLMASDEEEDFNLTGHRSTDEEPVTRGGPKKTSPKKPSGPRYSGKGIPLAVQLQLPYNLLSNVTAAKLPVTSQVLAEQAAPCAAAWDQFLLRYPALREKIEQGMIAGDVIALIMAHLPILAAAREEIQARAQMAEQHGNRPYQPAA